MEATVPKEGIVPALVQDDEPLDECEGEKQLSGRPGDELSLNNEAKAERGDSGDDRDRRCPRRVGRPQMSQVGRPWRRRWECEGRCHGHDPR
jgi:hypothetical protein